MSLVYTAKRAESRRGRPDPRAPAAGSVYRLHLDSCRYVQGSSTAQPITFGVWIALLSHAAPTDDYRLCKVCRPDESAST